MSYESILGRQFYEKHVNFSKKIAQMVEDGELNTD